MKTVSCRALGFPAIVPRLRRLVPGLLWHVSGLWLFADPLGTAFTYQGRLQDGTNFASGVYDFRFAVYDAPEAGRQIGGVQTISSVVLSNGVFTVQIDPGYGVFDGGARWLDTGVRTNGARMFSPLSPREPLTPTPYAVFATEATRAGGVAPASISAASLAVPVAPSEGQFLAYEGGTLRWSDASGAGSSGAWKLGGNAGTSSGANFLGTTDNQPLQFKANSQLVLSLDTRGSLAMGTCTNGAAGTVALGGYSSASGLLATAVGYRSTAGGAAAVALGDHAVALGDQSIAAGLNVTARGNFSFAAGIASRALEASAIAMGTNAVAGGWGAVALGVDTSASGRFSTALGSQTSATGFGSLAAGSQCTASGFSSLAAGNTTKAQGYGSVALGWYANAAHDYSFVWGDGDDYWNTKSSADHQFVIYARGGVGIGGPPGGDSLLDVQGNCRINDHDYYLRTDPDRNHGIGWYGEAPDGPVIYGAAGGALGTRTPGESLALGWDARGIVTVDPAGQNQGRVDAHALTFGKASAEGLSSQRLGDSGNPLGLDLFTDGKRRLSIRNDGGVLVAEHVGIGSAPDRVWTLTVNGEAAKSGGGMWMIGSDARIKTEVATVTNALETLAKVRLVSFRYTDDYLATHVGLSDHPYFSVIAQEYARVFPDFVNTTGAERPQDGALLQVDPYPLTVYSAAAVQELHRQVRDQAREIESLRERLEALERRLSSRVTP